jgi:NAD(P)-dependent dehydrogenase (short-subunit alcohol dehydrogenase family)
VTGASAGVGRATALAFAAQGANVALLARGRAGLEAAARDVERLGGRALPLEVDVADGLAVEAAADRAQDVLGPLDVWVNVAFTSVFAPVEEIGFEEYRRVTEVTYLGVVHGTKAALRRMRPANHGAIVQVGSALGERAIPLQSAYCAAKHAVNGFTEALRCELLHDRSGVRVTVVQLPAVNTPQFDWVLSRLPRKPQPVPPIYQPEVAARAVVFAADHPNRKQYWVGASTTATLLAQRFAAPLLDRYLARTGYGSQQTDQEADPDRPANLWHPVDGTDGHDFGAHGSFDDQSHGRSALTWLAERVTALTSPARDGSRFVGGGGGQARPGRSSGPTPST